MRLSLTQYLIAMLLITAGVTFVGCYRNVYVYEYADGRRIESNFPISQNPRIEIIDLKAADADGNAFAGQWTGDNLEMLHGDRSLMLTLTSNEGRSRHGVGISSREIAGTVTAASFEIKRESGVLKFDRSNDRGGTLTLTIDPAFIAAVTDATGEVPSAEQKLRLFQNGMTLAYVRAVKDSGLQPTLDELFDLRNGGVSGDYIAAIRKAGYDFKPKQIINLSRNGISKEYAVGLKDDGFQLDDAQLVNLSRNGISREYARDMKAAGYGNVGDIIELSRNGVSRSYAQQLGQGGKRSAKALIEMSRNGVSPSFGEALAKVGYDFNDQDLIKLARNGVGATYAKSILEAGYKFSADDLVELARNGVGSDYARKIKLAGYDPTAADLVNLSRNGVSSSFVASLHDSNKPNLSIDAIVDLSRKGVDATTVKRIRGL